MNETFHDAGAIACSACLMEPKPTADWVVFFRCMAGCRRFLRLASLSDSRCGSLSHVSLQPACLARRIVGGVSAKWFGYFVTGENASIIRQRSSLSRQTRSKCRCTSGPPWFALSPAFVHIMCANIPQPRTNRGGLLHGSHGIT